MMEQVDELRQMISEIRLTLDNVIDNVNEIDNMLQDFEDGLDNLEEEIEFEGK